MADEEYDGYIDDGDDGNDDGDDGDDDVFDFGDGEADAGDEGEDDGEKDTAKNDDDDTTEVEGESDLTDFQKMLNLKQNNDQRKTANRLTKFELPAILGYRATQIAQLAPPLVEVGGLTNPASIAEKELSEGKIPLTIERPLPSSKIGKFTYENRSLDDLINPNYHM